ncbi:DegT/DnrJ/EryC1/StrS family aminotransferase [Prevotella copri]|uniref:DegT/DnrJ/EryC1/StrS family aminotransferase n=1 Tax=Segatella copri TaxID=165179 RepID=A0A6I2U2E0_9BACT|nr:DegT/DnrJ/EryC1/StrS family aminotransferase [Segatella copri]MST78748.1 DegT/DnrJ/EryC1/StrS family aminotransferase [Segatella copri]
MDNKLITVTSPLLPNLDEFHEMLQQIWDSKWITNNGQFHRQLEAALKEYLGVPQVSLFTNGTLPLLTALQALRITGEVITTPYSFVATTHSIWWAGCKPVFVDIDPKTGNLDPDKIEAAITPKTTAIMPVHCYGKPCDVRRIKEIADKYGLKVIYDAAHAFALEIPKNEADYKCAFDEARNAPEPCPAVKREDQKVETESILNWGDMSTLSFHATKVYNTIEGGAMIMPNEETKKRIDFLKNFGFADEVTVVGPGINSKVDEMRAAYGLLNLRQVDAAIAARQQVAIKYREALRDVEGVTFFDDMPGVKHNYSYFPCFIDAKAFGMTRDELYFKMKEANVLGRRYFYPLISEFSTYRGLESADPKNLPNAHKMADSVICLPMHHELTDNDIERTLEFFKKK